MKKKRKQRSTEFQAIEEVVDISSSSNQEIELVCENEEGELIRELAKIESRDRPKASNNFEHQRGAEKITNGDQ
ncbi:hypothetical protein A2U01_0030098 [Trifolium medium]|uniref:Uncharacterized protein n=1 Tax=Trifolium medium TaxID=97028 RepID=A0A392PDS4_9FABA|nr:hypothetical protein [Trifolium medium]